MGNTIIFKGVVVKTTGSWYTVINEKNEVIACRIRGKFRTQGIKTTNPVAVGDEVYFQCEKEDATGVIIEVAERRNCIIRKATKLSKQTHILAANLDQVCLVVTLAFPRTSTGFIDRFLVTAAAYHVPVILCFNKIDLYDDELKQLHQQIISIYRDAHYVCLELSAVKKINTQELSSLLKDKTTLFSGHSGSGKSALINAIDSNLQLRTESISEWSMKGKHTTTFAEMLYTSSGARIIDSPGIKEFGMVDFSKEELSHFYPEMLPLIPHCRYSNCTHEHEPDCAVKKAVENGTISLMRYSNYLHILNGEEMALQDWEVR